MKFEIRCFEIIQKFWSACYTVDLVIFAYLKFREFFILRLLTKFRIRNFLFLFSSDIITRIFARIREFLLFAKFAKNKTSRILPDLQY